MEENHAKNEEEQPPLTSEDVDSHPVLEIAKNSGLISSKMKKVSPFYYERSLEERAKVLGAPSIHHLCKTIVLENQKCINKDCADPNNSRFYCVVLQYSTQLQSHKIFKFVRTLVKPAPQKNYHFRYAKEEDSARLTGYDHNGVTPFGMKENIPIILSEGIAKLDPPIFWLGGGSVDHKLMVKTDEFISILKPFVIDLVIDPKDENESST
eukprot:TRINITY_DN6977_c0_g1_i1.p1 TRINITY_DN6977_c0_g1~~TRINITY_DN6977_c0_g1_i1.p1  ORF type:complete len:210 (+),score=75.37 TRINITY_DN6977_c0_g1_i1:1-630(+)